MKVYISGAITNNPAYRVQFELAEAELTAEGHAVLNPCKNEGFTYREYINMGLCELMHCDAIYMLEGWENSTGAKLEYEYAVAVGLEVMEHKPQFILDKDVIKAVSGVKMQQEKENWRKKQNLLAKEKKQLKDTVEVLEFLLKCFENIAKPRVQYKRIRAALRMAIVAVERATPKEVLEKHCPVCGGMVAFRNCERCGQRLEW